MPTFTTFETIKNVMLDKKAIRWKVLDEEDELLNLYEPPASTPAIDSANTLKEFLDDLEGTNYVRVFVFDPKFKGQKGGDTSNTVYRYYYRLKPAKNGKSEAGVNGLPTTGIGLGDYLTLFERMNEMNIKMQLAEKDREIERLKEKGGKDKRYSHLEALAEKIGEGFFKEMKKHGYGLGDTEEPVASASPEENKSAPAVKPNKVSRPEVTKSDFGKRGGQALKRLAKVGGLEVVSAMEEMADIAETDPMRLVQLLQQLKGGE